MEKQKTWNQQFLEDLREKCPTYRAMVEFCADSIIMNNFIIEALAKKGLYFETYSGSDRSFYNADGDEITEQEFYDLENQGGYDEYDDIYQFFMISGNDAERFATYTNELIIYNDELDLYILCVKHWGTSWDSVPANWKTPEELKEED